MGRRKNSKPYLIDAYYAYARWGAKAKIDHLEQRYPQLLATIPATGANSPESERNNSHLQQ